MANKMTGNEESTALTNIMQLLDDLNKFEQGSILYAHIEQSLHELNVNHHNVEKAYAGFLSLLLEAFASHLPDNSTLLTHLKLVQTRLQPPLSLLELGSLSQCVSEAAKLISNDEGVDSKKLASELDPLVRQYVDIPEKEQTYSAVFQNKSKNKNEGAQRNQLAEARPSDLEEVIPSDESEVEQNEDLLEAELESMVKMNDAEAVAQPENHDTSNVVFPFIPKSISKDLARQRAKETRDQAKQKHERFEAFSAAKNKDEKSEEIKQLSQLELKVDSSYRAHLVEKSIELDKVRQDFIDELNQIVESSTEFGAQLKTDIEIIKITKSIKGMEKRRERIVESLESLNHRCDQLVSSYESARGSISTIEQEHKIIADEIERVKVLSQIDELTGLPNKFQFSRILEEEVSRTGRFKNQLSLILLNVDSQKEIEDEYTLSFLIKEYAQDVLSVFRRYDTVARYGERVFVVLMPNTDAHGAMKVVNKVKKRAGEHATEMDGDAFILPHYTVSILEYTDGEKPKQLLERVNDALMHDDKELKLGKKKNRKQSNSRRQAVSAKKPK